MTKSFMLSSTFRPRIAIIVAMLLGVALSGACRGGAAEPPAPPTVTTPSGLSYQDLKVGAGATAQAGQAVAVHYTGWIQEGGKRGSRFGGSPADGQPFTFRLGRGEVIPGWEEGVAGMRRGGVRRLTVPPSLVGYDGVPGSPVPAGATLIFEIELVDVNP